MTNKVYACIDGLANTAAVIDWAAWSALRLAAPLEFLHVLEPEPTQAAALGDYSGAIGLGTQDSLLQELSELDARRAKLAQEAGRRLLAAACERAAAAGVAGAQARLRHGELAEAAAEVQDDARLYVLGEHQRYAKPGARLHLDHHVERLIRVVQRPVLVVTGAGAFVPPRRFVIAFEGSATARKTVEMVARNPLLVGLPALIVMAGVDTEPARRELEEMRLQLSAAGFAEVQTELLSGEPEAVLPSLLKAQCDALPVMVAYGHSRIRQFIVGSTTTTLLRSSELPVLVLR